MISNFLWRLLENSGAQFVTLIVSIILARILAPSDYGLISLVNIFISILLVFVNQGLGNALIQKKDADETDFSTVFFTNIVFCVLLYGLLFFVSPVLAHFFGNPELTAVCRVLGLIIIVSGVKNVEAAYISKHMMFKKFFFATSAGTICSAVIGITMALHGFKVWSLVAQTLSNCLIDTVVLWFIMDWRPTLRFSLSRLASLFSYGWKLLLSALIDKLYGNLRSFIIGKQYSSEDLAYYNKGESWPRLFTDSVNTSIDSVLLPVMAQVQNDRGEVRHLTRRAIKTSTYVISPFLIGLCAVAEPLTRFLLTDKWLPCVPYMRIFCLSYLLYPIHTANLNAIKAVGRSDVFLKLEIAKKTVGLIILVISMQYGVMALAYSVLLSEFLCAIINAFPSKKLLNYGYLSQLKDILPAVLLSAGMGFLVFSVELLHFSPFMTLVLQVLCGITVYLFGSILFQLDSFFYLYEKLSQKLKSRKRSAK